MSMYTSGASIVCQAANGMVGKVDFHFNRVIFGAGIRVLDGGDPYRVEVGDWVTLLDWGDVSHPYSIDRLVVENLAWADSMLLHFSIGGDPEPPEHGSETEAVVVGLGYCPVGSALIDAGTALRVRAYELGVAQGPLVWDDETNWLTPEKPPKGHIAYVDFYLVLSILPPKA